MILLLFSLSECMFIISRIFFHGIFHIMIFSSGGPKSDVQGFSIDFAISTSLKVGIFSTKCRGREIDLGFGVGGFFAGALFRKYSQIEGRAAELYA